MLIRIVLCFVAACACAENVRAEKTVRVFVLAGQSNMEGQARNDLLESQAADPRFKDFWADYRTGDTWTERDDVFVTFFNRHGPLTVGYGSPGATGPELAFGRVLGDHCKAPVLLIKTAWGGHSLYKNFRPPSAGLPSEQALVAELAHVQKKQPAATMDEIKAGYGDSYRKMLAEVKRVLDEKDTLFHSLAGCKPEMAGFFWFQGFNDQFGDAASAEYGANMKRLITDVRKDFNAPKMPVLMAFETAPLYDKEAAEIFPTWQENVEEWKKVGSDRPYHYLGSGIWYSRIGKTAGELMVELLGE